MAPHHFLFLSKSVKIALLPVKAFSGSLHYDPAIYCNDILTNKTLILNVSNSITPFVSKRLNVYIMYDKASLKVYEEDEYMWSGQKKIL